MTPAAGKILSPAQLDALARVQAAAININRLLDGINGAIKSHDLPLKPAMCPSLGFLMHDIEGLIFAHDGATERDLMRQGMNATIMKAAA